MTMRGDTGMRPPVMQIKIGLTGSYRFRTQRFTGRQILQVSHVIAYLRSATVIGFAVGNWTDATEDEGNIMLMRGGFCWMEHEDNEQIISVTGPDSRRWETNKPWPKVKTV